MIRKGTIVLVPFPFTDLSGQKLRPALVISKIQNGDDVVLVFISSKKTNSDNRFDVEIRPDTKNGLKVKSFIKCSKIATLDKKVIIGDLGKLDEKKTLEVDRKIKNLLLL